MSVQCKAKKSSTFDVNMAIWISPRRIDVCFLVYLVIVKLVAILIVPFRIAPKYGSLVPSMGDPLQTLHQSHFLDSV